jgi:hypothetical protein
MLLNFLTALAWIWGGFWGLGFLSMTALALFANESKSESERTQRIWRQCFILAIPAWAWLIARYWM